MTEIFTIASRDRGASLILSPLDGDYFSAQLIHPGLDAQARVGSYMCEGLGDFFAGMADDWKGWSGSRTWASLEGELRLSAESDRTGHVYLGAHLHDGAPARWTVELGLIVEAGQLERLASMARAFEKSVLSAT